MALQDFRYQLPIRVVFRDIDFYRHVNNAVYITWTETARIDYCKVAFDRPLGSAQNVIMAAQNFTYEKQVEYDEEVVVGCRCSRIGNKSLDLAYEIHRDGERVAHGVSTLVAYDYEARRSIPVPDDWRRKIVEYEIVAPSETGATARTERGAAP